MPIIRRTRLCTASYGVLHWLCWLWLCGAGTRAVCTVKVTVRLSRTLTFTVHTARVPAPHNHSQHNQCKTPYAAVHNLVLLMVGIMMPETCWDKSLMLNIRLVASCWFLFLHPTFMTHGHTSLKFTVIAFVLHYFTLFHNAEFWSPFCYYAEWTSNDQKNYEGNGSTVVKVLRYKSEGRWFDSRWCHWNFSITYSFRSHYGPGVDSASNRNEYQEYFLEVKAAGV